MEIIYRTWCMMCFTITSPTFRNIHAYCFYRAIINLNTASVTLSFLYKEAILFVTMHLAVRVTGISFDIAMPSPMESNEWPTVSLFLISLVGKYSFTLYQTKCWIATNMRILQNVTASCQNEEQHEKIFEPYTVDSISWEISHLCPTMYHTSVTPFHNRVWVRLGHG